MMKPTSAAQYNACTSASTAQALACGCLLLTLLKLLSPRVAAELSERASFVAAAGCAAVRSNCSQIMLGAESPAASLNEQGGAT